MSDAQPDPHGYVRLTRWLAFLADECTAFGLDAPAADVRRALRFRSGSPTEYLTAAEEALAIVLAQERLPAPLRGFALTIVQQIDEGFQRIGGA
jgi:hypothetical protein